MTESTNKSRDPPLSESLVFGPPQGEGSNIQVGFNLDSHNPIACSLDDEMFLDGPYFSPNHVSVDMDEHVVFTIRAFTDEYYVEWEILVEALVDGKSKTFTVRDGDRLFRTTAFADSYNAIFDFDFTAGRFIRLPPGYRFSDLGK